MSQRTDWLPSTRQNQLNAARVWLAVFAEDAAGSKGQTAKKHAVWSIPAETITELDTLYGQAEAALTAAQGQETRTPVTTAACKTAFDILVAAMRNSQEK